MSGLLYSLSSKKIVELFQMANGELPTTAEEKARREAIKLKVEEIKSAMKDEKTARKYVEVDYILGKLSDANKECKKKVEILFKSSSALDIVFDEQKNSINDEIVKNSKKDFEALGVEKTLEELLDYFVEPNVSKIAQKKN